jgi:hypothetical protein
VLQCLRTIAQTLSSSSCLQIPCRFNGGVVVNVDRFRTSMGGWVRLLFKNVNGSPISRVEFSKVSRLLAKQNADHQHLAPFPSVLTWQVPFVCD